LTNAQESLLVNKGLTDVTLALDRFPHDASE